MLNKLNKIFLIVPMLMLIFSGSLFAQKPYRVGTTAANFLEIGYGAAGNAMGDAYVSMVNDLSSVYWNPAGLGLMKKSEAIFSYQPWFAGINTSFAAVGVNLDSYGVVAVNLIHLDYGEIPVTTLEMQDGTGETYQAQDLSIGLSYGKRLADWFAFGATLKYISSSIWHTSASSFALDLGVKINTRFFSMTGENMDGLAIGMSVSNYGTPMQFDGIDLVFPIDIAPNEDGNYKDTPGQFRMQNWELPLIFRLGISANPIVIGNHRLTVAIDALHPNNNSEYLNAGIQYQLTFPAFGIISLRGGYKGIFMEESHYGFSFGAGFETFLLHNDGIKINYSFREHDVLGATHTYGIGIKF